MLPQPNFGRDRDPGKGAPEPEGDDPNAKPKKLLRLQIALWVEVVSAVVAGNILAFYTFSLRSASVAELTDVYENSNMDLDQTPAETAQAAHDFYQSTNFLASNLVIAGFALVAAIVAALCAVRLKSRQKAVRWWAVGATAVLFIVGMFMSTIFGLYVGPWVFASILALWWLFSADIRYWMDGSAAPAAEPRKKRQQDDEGADED
ncbi:hypothetical protein [Glycomyces artemisiae]|uniref:DUF4064 domain-containing protein n=1 Tax=Glycomyces artemisiae TaxID=1076443 RepID=A0A2T0UHN2_9ACTN|nr:hypothetical protein [Glycomyces artemisiae]PRY57450.1 hypothetical protein B0I28_107299 [Glycomyces artemisiae]